MMYRLCFASVSLLAAPGAALQESRTGAGAQLLDDPSQEKSGPEVLVTSLGGCGSTSFMQELSGIQPMWALNSKRDDDHLKHRPFHLLPKAQLTNLKAIIYLHCNYTHAVESLSRRGYLVQQAKKTRSGFYNGPKSMNLERYALTPGDEFLQAERHLDSFLSQCEYPVAYLDVTAKTTFSHQLARFLHLPYTAVDKNLKPWNATRADFFEDEEFAADGKLDKDVSLARQSSEFHTSALLVDALNAKFAQVQRKLSAMGGFHVQKANCEDRAP